MPKFGKTSESFLAECHPELVLVARKVIQVFDVSIIEAKRGMEVQNKLFKQDKTQVQYPNSDHNTEPLSDAMHMVPYPVDWNDRERFTLMAGYALMAAHDIGVNLIWGGDWDQDTEVADNSFDDMAHFARKSYFEKINAETK